MNNRSISIKSNRNFFLSYALCLFFISPIIGQPLLPNKAGDQLLDKIREKYTPNQVLRLAQTKVKIYSSIDNVEGKVSTNYCNQSIDLPAGADPSIWLFQGNAGHRGIEAINLEHFYPQSKGAQESTSGNIDMHHLHPSRTPVNADRASHPFYEIDDNITSAWYTLAEELQSPPDMNRDLYSEYFLGALEPPEEKKGDIARAVFYFHTIYEENVLAADINLFKLMQPTLSTWDVEVPVDDAELLRRHKVAIHQGNEYLFSSYQTIATRPNCTLEICAITDLEVFDFTCNTDGSYNMVINFTAIDPGNDFYDIWINNEMAGFFALEDLPQVFEEISPRSNSDYDIIRVCINDQPDCCSVIEYMQPDCNNQSCSIRDLAVTPSDCNDDQLFSVDIDFIYEETAATFSLAGNGINYGTFNYADLPITILGFNGDCMTEYEFIVQDSKYPDCSDDITFGPICCGIGDCAITDLEVFDFTCNTDGSYNMVINFTAIDPGNDFYDIWINNEMAGFFALEDLPQVFEEISPRSNSDYDIIRVCINDQPDCCSVIEYMQPDCLTSRTTWITDTPIRLWTSGHQINIDARNHILHDFQIRITDVMGRVIFADLITYTTYSRTIDNAEDGIIYARVWNDKFAAVGIYFLMR